MKVFLSIKFWGDMQNREHIEGIINAVERAGFRVFCFVRNAEKWGDNHFKPDEMMKVTFDQIDESVFLVADVSDWPIGVGVEAGYAYAKNIPIICICDINKKIANTVAGLATQVIMYKSYEDLSKRLASLKNQLPESPIEQ